jgi:serine/threonine-protein kinase
MSLALSSLDHRIELRGLLGAGGMGEVHRAWDAALARAVAVKFLRGPDPQAEERLLLEARLQARVEHPNVVHVHEVGTLGGRPCIVLQLVEGRSLADVASGLTVEAKVELLRQAAAGLHAAHRQGLVHRDIKPGNVLVEEQASGRRALVTDFGLARAEDAGLSRSGLPPGTLDFMSPEQLLGPGPADYRSDIYALGATLYATLAGRPPFRSGAAEQDEERQVLVRIAEDDPPPLPPSAPRELSVIAARAMEKDPASRYPTAEAFGDDLARFQRGEPIHARPPTLGTRARKWARRNRGLARALVVAVAAVLLAGGHALWTARRATLAALEAARLGALAESMEADLRMEYLSPAHDLRPARARLRAQVDSLRAGATHGGPASFALGKGLLLVGDLGPARAALQQSWDSGLQTPEVAEALGNALGGLYREGRELAVDTLPPGSQRDERLRALQSELRDPAVRMLARGGVSGWRAEWLAARVALLEEDFASARERAARVLAADPGRYEALGVEAEAWLGEAVQHSMREEGDAALGALEHADTALARAVESGRSDPGLAADVIELHAGRMQQLTKQSRPLEEESARLSAALDRLAALDPEDPRPLMQRGDAALRKAQNALPPDAMQLTDEALRLFRKARDLRPTDPRPHQRLGAVSTLRAYALQELGQLDPALAAAREGLVSLDRSLALAPMSARTELGRMMLLSTEAGVLRRKGQPSGEALRAALAAGERCMELDARRTRQVQADMCETLVELGREEWLEGKDPLPTVRRGLALGEQAARPGPRERARLASVYDLGASLAVAVGADHKAWQARALTLLDETLASLPDHTDSLAIKAEVLAGSAWYGVQRGEDPLPRVAEATRWIGRAAAAGERGAELTEAGALLPLSEASWLLLEGRDPTTALARAEKELSGLVSERPDDVAARALLAECAVVRATFLRRGGRPHAEVARRGLAQLDQAMALQPRDPSLWVIRARLQALSDQPEKARESLSRAVAMNPLVKAGREAVLARAEIDR